MSKISIILPLYNSAEFIATTIESVLRQSYRDFELIVIDDCSNDQSMKVVRTLAKLDARINCHSTEQNSGGPAHPRNIGLSVFTGDVVAFIDSDDLWHPEKLEYQLNEMRNRHLDFSACNSIVFFDEPNSSINRSLEISSHEPVNRLTHERLLKKNIVANSSVMLTASSAQKLIFSEDPRHVAVEDYLAWLQLHQNTDIRSEILPAKTLYYRNHLQSLSRSKWAMAKKIFGLLGDYNIEGKGLGLKRYYYFLTYIHRSLTKQN